MARHLGLLRDLQQETGGFTEYIPLVFVPYHTPLGHARGIKEMVPKEDAIRRAGRVPVRRDTLYHYLDTAIQTR